MHSATGPVRSALISVAVCALAAFGFLTFAGAQTKPQEKTSNQPAAAETKQSPPPSQQPSPPATQQPRMGTELDNGPLITNTDLITLTVTVTDTYGRYVSGLSQKAFSVFDEKHQQEITFFSDDDAPVSVGVIFDVSGSMSGDKIKRARDALAKFIQTSHNADEYFLIAFNSRAQLLLDKTRNGDAVLDKLTFVQTKNQTALYDACYLGVERVQRGAHPKRALLLISDGQDNNSRYTFNEVRRLLKESDVVLYSIGILSGSDSTNALGMEGQGILDELSGVSGGKAFFPRSAAEMDDIFEQIALELRHQYSIGYKPSNFTNDGKWHRIKVKVSPPRGLPRLFVRSKEGYYAIPGQK
ncbi:MAG TPA: VWA domain-containing protein [Pyrinomonadaceae bacterium]|nr:VWA domain-containing protein [Pyrinomonadaceae bacterium]